MDAVAAAAAEEDGRPVRRQPRPVGRQEQIGLQFLAMGFADLPQIGRADLLAGLDDEFGIEAELAAARLAHRAQGREIDAVLPLVVSRAAAIDALASGRGLPRIEIVAPFTLHALDHVAVAIGEDGRQRGILAIIRQQIRPPAGRRFDQARGEAEFGKGRLQVLDEIGAQRLARSRSSGFRCDRRPCGRVRRETRRNGDARVPAQSRRLYRPYFSVLHSLTFSAATYRDSSAAGSGATCRMGLAKPGGNAAISGNSPAFDRAEAGGTLRASGTVTNEEANSAQRLRHELRGASIARALDPSARPHARIQPPALLARPGEDAGARPVRRAVSRRRARRLRRLRQQPGRGAAQRGADALQRAA